jgi:Mg-chelatase subunit ChlD
MRTPAALVLLCAIAAPAAADTALATHGGGTVLEASFELDIEVRGLFATVEMKQRLLAGGTSAVEAVYVFELPGEAAVTGFALAHGSGKAADAVIATDDGVVDKSSAAIGDDMGALEQLVAGRAPGIGDPGLPSLYRYTAYPVGSDGVTASVRWVMPVRLEQGRLVIALPVRRGLDLADVAGTIRFTSVPGLSAAKNVRAGGTVVAKAPGGKAVAWKLAASEPIVIEAEVTATGEKPVFLAETVAIGKGQGAIAAAVVTPPAKAAREEIDRLVVVVDASRSMRRIDHRAVVAAVKAITATAPSGAKLLGVAFDREARRLVPEWKDNSEAAREAIATAVEKLGDVNGTDLAAALALAAGAIDTGHRGRIVIITDGGFDPAVDATALAAAIGKRDDLEVASLVVVPNDRPAPESAVSTLSELARAMGGRVRVARADELADRARGLSAGLADATTYSGLEVAGTTLWFPKVLAAGDGAASIGWYHGAAKPSLVIFRGEKVMTIAARTAKVGAAALALAQPGSVWELVDAETADAMARANAASDTPAPSELGIDEHGVYDRFGSEGTMPPADALKTWTAEVRARGVVTRASSALVVDTATKLGRDRRASIARGAPFVRLPPQPERDMALGGIDAGELAPPAAVVTPAGGVLDPDTLKNIFSIELLGRLRACYQAALPRDPRLAGRVRFDVLIGDGEVIAVTANGADNETFRGCLVRAVHQIQVPPVADPSLIRVRYPVDFTVAADKSFVVLGDADSAEPLDPSLLPTPSTDPIDTTRADDPLDGLHR